jgi:molybdate transport system substrate-binding protein
VRQALDYVARGEVDAGFVYATDAAIVPGKVRIALSVPTATPLRYPAAPVAGSANPALARLFVDFLSSAAARSVLLRHGFGAP